ncbi:MAG: LacI family DNA-binding transcriptional regulator [Candidatus Marinimicrobia bacterium]|nr:LacI family DNA-binding transcriptional regulator [Candidatus Neomarinimicrobiota bacterium]
MTTIKDIARLANCSLSTVSKALNGRRDVSKVMRERILYIAQQQKFTPNAFGKGLKNKRTESVGVIFCRETRPLSMNPFYSRVLEGIEAELVINNYNLVLHLLSEEYHGELPKLIKEHTVDGIILAGILDHNFVEQVKKTSIPVVFVNPNFLNDDYDQIFIDDEHGALQATQYLINKGHKRIGFISGDLERKSFLLRYQGYRKALAYNKIEYDDEIVRTGGLENGYEQVATLMKQKNRVTAIFATNDLNAIYGYKAVEDTGLRIPQDVSIIGFDDIDLSKIANPPLTTIRVYKEEMGSIAVRVLLQLINKENRKPTTTLLPVKLIERDSVRDYNLSGN